MGRGRGRGRGRLVPTPELTGFARTYFLSFPTSFCFACQVLDDYLRKTLGADKEQAKAFWGEHAGGQDVRDWETISVATLAASLEPKPAKKAKKAKEGGASGKSSSGKAKKRKAAAEGDGDGGGGGAAAGDDY